MTDENDAERKERETFQANYDLGIAYVEMHRFSDAVHHLQIACEMRPAHDGCRKALDAARLEQSKRAKLG